MLKTTKFQGLMVVKVANVRILKPGLTSTQREYLQALGVNDKVFIDPRPG